MCWLKLHDSAARATHLVACSWWHVAIREHNPNTAPVSHSEGGRLKQCLTVLLDGLAYELLGSQWHLLNINNPQCRRSHITPSRYGLLAHHHPG
jgi:hypothetical protein